MKFFLVYICAIMTTLSVVSEAKINLAKHPIYAQIIRNAPNINRRYAFKLSNILHKVCSQFTINCKLYTAMLAQESMYQLRAKNCTKGLARPTDKHLTKVCLDFGISQINVHTARRKGFNTLRLTTDLEYSVRAGARILRDFKRRFPKEENYWSRYNSSTPHHREHYEKQVTRWLD